MNGTKKPVQIHTSNKWSSRTDAGEGELEVEMDRLTLREVDQKSSKNNVIQIVK